MRPIRILLLTAIAWALVACQPLTLSWGTRNLPGPARLHSILASGELRVGISGDFPPLNMKNKKGEIIGFEVDVIEALADAMGLEIEFIEHPFPDLLDILEEGGVDLVISGLTITPERNARVAFAGPYFISGASVLARSQEIADAQDTDRLDDPRLRYAALAGSTSATFVRERLPRAKLTTTRDYDAAVQMVIDGKVDALVADHQICMLTEWQNPDAGLSAGITPLTVEPLGIALPADAPLLLNLVTNYLNTLENTGLLTQFKAKWLNDGSWVAELP